MQKKIQHLNLGDIIYDSSYMIRKLNEHTVNRYALNMRAGAVFPPLVLTESKKLVCGFHRYEAYSKTQQLDKAVPVIIKVYKQEKDIFLDAVRDNTVNGLPLTKFEIRQAIYRGQKYDIKLTELAKILNITDDCIEKWGSETVIVINNKKESIEEARKGEPNTYVFENNKTSRETYEDIKKSGSGWSFSFHAMQIIKNIKWKSFESNEKNILVMQKLKKSVDDWLEGINAR